MRHLGAIIVIASLASCESGPEAEPAPFDAPLAHSFLITVTPTYEPSNTLPLPAESLAFQLRLDDQGELTGALGSVGRNTVTFTLRHESDGRRVLTAPINMPLQRDSDACSSYQRAHYEELTLVLHDDDENGTLDRITGTARGTTYFFTGERTGAVDMDATLEGTLDVAPPSLLSYYPESHHVLDPIVIRASEPLDPTTTAWLRTESGDDIELMPCCDDIGPTLLKTPDTMILPHATTFMVEVVTPLRDLAGNQGIVQPLSISTIEDPGLLTDPSFETSASALLRGPAAIYTGGGAIAGTRALSLDVGGRATLRVPVPQGASRLVVPARVLLGGDYTFTMNAAVRLRTPQGQTSSFDLGTWLGVLARPMQMLDEFTYASAVVVQDIPLPPGTTDEVYVDIVTAEPFQKCPVPTFPSSGLVLLVDDLHAE